VFSIVCRSWSRDFFGEVVFPKCCHGNDDVELKDIGTPSFDEVEADLAPRAEEEEEIEKDEEKEEEGD
jgi:hypothetical protein